MTAEELLRERFVMRADVHARQGPEGQYVCVREPLTAAVLRRHLEGKVCVGVYALKESRCKWLCIDVDGPEGHAEQAVGAVKALVQTFTHFGITPYVEFSGKKGWHLWVFVEETEARLVRQVGAGVIAECGPAVDECAEVVVYPKQDQVEASGFGNLVKLPWGKRADNGRRGRFVNPLTLEKLDQEQQFELLLGAVIHSPLKLETLCREHEWERARVVPDKVAIETHAGADLPCYEQITDPDSDTFIPQGHRDEVMFSFAKQAFRRGMPEKKARRDLHLINRERCRPELAADVVEQKVTSAYRSRRRSAGCEAIQEAYLCPALTGFFCPVYESQQEKVAEQDETFQRERGWELSIEPLFKLATDPPIFTATVSGHLLELGDKELLSWRLFKERCLSTLHLLPRLPRLRDADGKLIPSQSVWEMYLAEAMKAMTILSAPPDASPRGAMWDAICSFLTSRAACEERERVKAGQVVMDGEFYYFRSETWRNHQALVGADYITLPQTWKLIRDKGGENCTLRFGVGAQEVVRAWRLPIKVIESYQRDPLPGEHIEELPDTPPPLGLLG